MGTNRQGCGESRIQRRKGFLEEEEVCQPRQKVKAMKVKGFANSKQIQAVT